MELQERSEFEREMLQTARLVRRVIDGVGVAVGLGLLVAIVVGGIASLTGDSSSRGSDVHAPLRTGSVAQATTESGTAVRVTITNLTWSQQGEGEPKAPVLTVSIKGGEPESLAADAWTLVLADASVLASRRLEEQQPQTYRFWLEGSLPTDSEVRFVHFNPDSSHGDIYFDVAK